MIRFLDVQKSYNSEHGKEDRALKGITLNIEDGEFVFLVGPSGSGKSTIIKLITGEIEATGGRIMVNGYNMMNIRRRQLPEMRRTLGVIFQDFRLIDKKTVWENLAFAMRAVGANQREITRRIPYVLDLVGLYHKEDRYPDELSGGEQQRVAIARSMASGAQVLLADEPTGNLDGENSRNVVELLSKLAHEDNYCVVIVTHDPAIAEASDTVYRMADGVLTQEK